jgi:hypothetical protein
MAWFKGINPDYTDSKALPKYSSEGSVSMEYIIVSCFALMVSVTAVTWIGKITKDRIASMAQRLQVDTNDLNFDFDMGGGE